MAVVAAAATAVVAAAVQVPWSSMSIENECV